MNYTVRPIDTWPNGTLTPDHARQFSRFKASWRDTLGVLDRELDQLRATNVVMMLDVAERDCRLDGQLRADAKPGHPGVILAFDSKHGPLKYATDTFKGTGYQGFIPGWQANVRAIALGLEALRRVDRYGITQRGEQYTGWKALGAGIAMPAAAGFTSIEEAAAFVAQHAGTDWDAGDLLDRPGVPHDGSVERAYRIAAKALHPDAGGDPDQFKRLTEARRMLTGA